MDYSIFTMTKDHKLCISSLKKDIMWNGCEISNKSVNVFYEKPLHWLCVNPNEICINIRNKKNENSKRPYTIMLRIHLLKYKKTRLELIRKKLALTYKLLNIMK